MGFGGRVRDMRQGPDGPVSLVTDEDDEVDGKLVRVLPQGLTRPLRTA